MDYTDSGYNEYFERSLSSQSTVINTIDSDVLLEGIGEQSLLNNSVSTDKISTEVGARLFTSSDDKENIENWKYSQDATKIDGGNIFTNTLSAQALKTSTLSAGVSVGDDNILIDGENKRILIKDGSGIPRILIGYQQGGF